MSKKTVKTICFDCHSRCGVLIEVEDNKIVSIKGDKEHPISRGHICMKGLAASEIINHPDRIRYPLKRVGKKGEGKFERISWDEALNTISERLLGYREQFGAESVVITRGTTRGMPPYMMPFLSQFGSPNFCPTVNYSLGPILIGFAAVGVTAMADPELSKCIVLWGHNPEQSFPGLLMQDIREGLKSGAKLIVVDPRGIPLAKKADHWLRVRPGTDVALLLSFINVIIKNELYDKEFVEKWTFGFEQLREHVSKYTPEYCSEITWIPADLIEKAALTFGKTKPACIMPGIGGACHSINSFDLARSIAILIAITGNLEVPGGHVIMPHPTGATRNCYGSDFSVTKGMRPKQIRKKLGSKQYPFFQFIDALPPEPIYKAILEEDPYPVKAVGFFAHNPMCALGNSQYVKKGLEALEFMFSVDYFHTPTTNFADIILPPAHWTERDDVEDLAMKNYVFSQPKALEPIAECKSEKQIFIDLAKRMGLNDYWKTIEESLDYRLEPAGVTYEELKQTGHVSVPIEYKGYEKRGGFNTPTKKIMLYTKHLEPMGIAPLPEHKEPPESPVSTPELWKEYPLILTTGNRIIPFYHSGLRNIPSLRKAAPDPELQIHPETAKELGMDDGNWVYLSSPRGRVEIKLKFFEGTHPKVVHSPHGYWYGVENGWKRLNINQLTDNQTTDPVTASLPLKGLLCRIEKMNP